jgi:hypothetical protein
VNGGDEASSGRDSLLYTLVQRLQLQRQVNATSRRSWRVHTELTGASAQYAHAEQHAHLLALPCLSSSSSTRIFKMTALLERREPVGSEPGVPRPTRRLTGKRGFAAERGGRRARSSPQPHQPWRQLTASLG